MKDVLFFSVVGLLLATTTAIGQDVRYNFDKNTDFSKFKTYKWEEGCGRVRQASGGNVAAHSHPFRNYFETFFGKINCSIFPLRPLW